MKGLFAIILFCSCVSISKTKTQQLPGWLKGNFDDDYGMSYTVSDSVFVMEGAARYRILQWNEKEQYLLAQNDTSNKSDKGLYTRIDYMQFTGMEPFTWGYCFTVFNAPTLAAALKAAAADRANPRTGCNGYPFSRMKRRG